MWQGALSHRFRHVARPNVECRTLVCLPNRVHGWATRAAASLLRLVTRPEHGVRVRGLQAQVAEYRLHRTVSKLSSDARNSDADVGPDNESNCHQPRRFCIIAL